MYFLEKVYALVQTNLGLQVLQTLWHQSFNGWIGYLLNESLRSVGKDNVDDSRNFI